MATDIRLGVGFDFDQSGLRTISSAIDQLQREVDRVAINVDTDQSREDIAEFKLELEQLQDIMSSSYNLKLNNINIDKFENGLKQAGLSMDALRQKSYSYGVDAAAAFARVENQARQIQMPLKQTQNILDKMAQTLSNTIKWNLASSAVNNMTGAISQAWGYTKSLDSSLNSIRIVTGQSADEMDRFAKTANSAAQSLGVATTDYTKASLIYAQQGLQGEDLTTRTEITSKVANVTGQSTQSVSEQLTAVWNGYKVSASEAELYIDRLAAVAAKSASNLEELSTGMSKVASSANMMGVSEEQLAAQLSTIISVTRQAPESVGTALKTIYSRMTQINAGMSEDGASLKSYTEDMAKYGISVLDAQGKLRDMGEVIEEIGGKWTNFTQEQQTAIAQTMGGARQYNMITALFENWDQYNNMMQVQATAAGTLQAQQDVYLESMSAHLQTMSTAAENVFDSLMNKDTTDGIKDLVDGFTSLLNVIASAVDSVNGLGGVLRNVGAIALTVFNRQLGQGFANFATKNLEAQSIDRQRQNLVGELQAENQSYDTSVLRQNMNNEKIGILNEANYISSERLAEINSQFDNLNISITKLEASEEILKNTSSTLFKSMDIKNPIEDIDKITQKTNEANEAWINWTNTQSNGSLFSDFDTASEAVQNFAEQGVSAVDNDLSVSLQRASINIRDITNEYNKAAQITKQPLINEADIQIIENGFQTLSQGGQVDLQQLNDAQQRVNAAFSKGGENIERTVDALNQYSAQIRNTVNQQEAFNFNMLEQSAKRVGQSLTQMTSGLVAFFNLWKNISNIKNILTDEDLSPMEKATQLISILTFTIPQLTMLYRGWKAAKDLNNGADLINLLLAKEAITLEGKKQILAATGIKKTGLLTAATLKYVGALILQKAVMHPLGTAIVAATVAIAGLTLAYFKAKQSAEDFNNAVAEKEALKEVSNKAKELQTAYEGIKSARDNLFDSIDTYQTEIDNLERLTKGTEEYKEALKAANEEALQLMTTYGLTGKLEDGLWTINEEDIENIKKQQETAVANAQQAALMGQIEVYQAQQDVDRALFYRPRGISESKAQGLEELYKADPTKFIDDIQNGIYNNIQQDENGNPVLIVDSASTAKDFLEFAKEYTENPASNPELAKEIGQAADTFTTAQNNFELGSKESFPVQLTDNAMQLFNQVTPLDKEDLDEFVALQDDQLSETTSAIKELTATILTIDAEKDGVLDKLSGTSQANFGGVMNAEYKAITGMSYQDAIAEQVKKQEEQGLDAQAIIQDSDLVKQISQEFGYSDFTYDEDTKQYEGTNALTGEKETVDKATIENWAAQIALQTTEAYANAQASAIKNLKSFEGRASVASEITGINEEQLTDLYAKEYAARKNGENFEYDYSVFSPEQMANLIKLFEQGGSIVANNIKESINYTSQTMTDYYSNQMSSTNSVNDLNNNLMSGMDHLDQAARNLRQTDAINENKAQLINTYNTNLLRLSETYENTASEAENFKEALQRLSEAHGAERDAALKQYEVAAMNLQISTLSGQLAEQYGLEAEEIEYYAKALKETDDYANANAESLTLAAKAQLRYNKSLKSAVSNLDSWKEALKNVGENGILDFEVAQQLQEAYGGLLDIDGSQLSNSFLTSSENLKLMEDAFNGVEGSYEQLAKNVSKDILITLGIDESQFEEDFNSLKSLAESQGLTIEANADLNNDKFLNGLEDIVNAAGMTADQATDYLTGMGIDATVEQETQEVPGDIVAYNTIPKPTLTKMTGFADIPGGGTEVLDYFIPAVSYDTTPVQTTKVVSANALTVTSATGSSGGQTKFNNRGSSTPKASKSGGGGGGGGGGGSAPKKAKVQKLTETKKDPFHNVERRLGDLTDAYDKLADAQDRLIGDKQIKNLEQQLDLLEEQKEVQEEKLQIANDEAKRLAENLKDNYKIAFGENGEITNYFEVMEKELKDLHDVETWYNTLSGDAQEDEANSDRLSQAQERYDAIVEDIQEYEDMLDKIDETAKSISDTIKSKIEIEIKKVQVKVEVSETLKDFRDAWTEFQKTLAQLEDSDFAQNFNYSVQTLQNIIDSNKLSALSEAINSNLALLKEYPNESTILDNLKEDTQGLIDTITEVYEAYGESQDIFEDGISQVKDYYDTQNDYYDLLLGQIDHLKSSYELIYGDEAYNKLSAFFDSQLEITQQQEQSLRDQVIYWEQMMQNAENEDIYQKYYENYKDATDAFNASVESTLEILKDQYSNTINDIFQQWSNELTNGAGLDNLESLFDMSQEANESFYDSAERGFKVQEIIDKWNDSINNSDNAAVQNKLTKAMNEQLSILEAKTKLNEKDVALAEKEIELILKQIAIEESQQAKNQMRLTRDTNGNYTYKFVANQTEVNKAEEERNKALSALYDETKSSYNEAQQNIISAQKELQDQLKEYAETYANDEEMFMLMSQAAIKSYQTRTESSAQTLDTTLEYFSKYAKEWFGEDLSDLSEQALMDYLNQNNIGATGFSYDEVMRLSNMIIDSNYMASLLAQMNDYRNNLGAASGTLESDVASQTEYALQALKNNGVDLSQAQTDLSAIASSIGIIEQVIEEINQGYKEIAEKGYNSYINAYKSNTSFEPQKILTDISNAVVDEVKIMNNIDIANKAMALAQDKVAQLSSNMDSNLSKVSSAIEKIVNNNTTIGNEFTVYADFSGVESSKEIKEAFNDMPNLVWQYIGKI